ncbi:MAG: trypsin-like peptidase domain-containing protein [Candidatus Cellulosilyticum pullistercoris]|uniref:Trypsin-like peptidase domain-containing protein n=1 Tax=Candidatus Cellulosilyticum pullistercoris TaxID=2838521 RepID=A0A9E2KCU5_9FIRM|nr:trypsin-like peptidase domain-containing protein [Candidatus Cellulosilyticum pullistercoris]
MNEQNIQNEEFIQSEMIEDRVIPAMVRVKEKKKKGKGIVITLAVALASFGAGSLYTSYSWIQDQKTQLSNQVTNQSNTNKPTTNVSQTSAITSGKSLSVAEVANLAADSVVEITTESVANDMFMRQYVTEGAGSGVIISEDGYIATNNHVIEGASKIVVRLTDGKEYEAKLIGTDTQTDVAVIKVDGVTLQPVTLGDSDAIGVGDTAIAIGNPLGELGGTVTNGIISALDRQIVLENQTMTLLQTNAAINPGNSGGGLFNDQGQLIGLVVAKSSGSNVEGLGFAIPVNVVKEVVESIINVGYVQGRPVLGVSVISVDSAQLAYQYGLNQLGVYVAGLTEGTKAEASGLQVGDCLIAVDDTQISSTSDLTKILQSHEVGDKVSVMVSRNGKMITLEVELSESKPTAASSNESDSQNTTKDSNSNQIPNISNFFGGSN